MGGILFFDKTGGTSELRVSLIGNGMVANAVCLFWGLLFRNRDREFSCDSEF